MMAFSRVQLRQSSAEKKSDKRSIQFFLFSFNTLFSLNKTIHYALLYILYIYESLTLVSLTFLSTLARRICILRPNVTTVEGIPQDAAERRRRG